jgi:hypothetical protein
MKNKEIELLIISHGLNHNDTIALVQEKITPNLNTK